MKCSHCGNKNRGMMDQVTIKIWFCKCCARMFVVKEEDIPRFEDGRDARCQCEIYQTCKYCRDNK